MQCFKHSLLFQNHSDHSDLAVYFESFDLMNFPICSGCAFLPFAVVGAVHVSRNMLTPGEEVLYMDIYMYSGF